MKDKLKGVGRDRRPEPDQLIYFKGLRRGFLDTLYVEEFLPFNEDDFDWEVSDLEEYHRTFSFHVSGKPKPHVASHIDALVDVPGNYTYSHKAIQKYRGELINSPKPFAIERVEFHHKGCRTQRQKDQRRLQAKRSARGLLKGAHKTNSLVRGRALDIFNNRMKELINCINERYVEVWVKTATKGNHRDEWVLMSSDKDWIRSAVRDCEQRAKKLAEAEEELEKLRKRVSLLRDEYHRKYQDLALVRFQEDNWKDKDDIPLPQEVQERITESLGLARESSPFE